jgi:hypothetical protein
MDTFYRIVDAHIQTLNEKYRAKYLIRREMHEDIILVLRDGWGGPKFKFWVQKVFVLVTIDDTVVFYNEGEVGHPVVI